MLATSEKYSMKNSYNKNIFYLNEKNICDKNIFYETQIFLNIFWLNENFYFDIMKKKVI